MSSELTNIIYGVELQVTVIIPSLAFDLMIYDAYLIRWYLDLMNQHYYELYVLLFR